MSKIQQRYLEECARPSDINEHLPTLHRYAAQCDHITELRSGMVVPTWALLAGHPKQMISIYVGHPGEGLKEVVDAAKDIIDFRLDVGDVLKESIETDLLFIDTKYTYEQVSAELNLYAGSTRKYIILHDTVIYGQTGEDGGKGLNIALNEFLEGNPLWRKVEEFTNNNGLTVLQKFRERELANLAPVVSVVKDGGSEEKAEKIIAQYLDDQKNIVFTKPDSVKFIIPFPDVPYYLWMVLVQINNFRRMGYEVDTHFIGFYFGSGPSEILLKMVNSDNVKANFHLYPDDRPDKTYPASSKPRMMKNYFRDFPDEKENIYMYLDPDVIFLKQFDFEPFIHDNIWYESDASSYLNSTYIKSKGDGLLEEMCDVVGISPEMVIENDKNAGGAQYILKNLTADYWEEVELSSIDLYKKMKETEKKYHPPGQDFPIQAWTSEMWTQNWVAWTKGIQTKIVSEMHFHWANHRMADINHSIFHNAGVATTEDPLHFCKIAYQSSPFRKEIPTKKESLSYLYKLEVDDTEKNFPDLIWD